MSKTQSAQKPGRPALSTEVTLDGFWQVRGQYLGCRYIAEAGSQCQAIAKGMEMITEISTRRAKESRLPADEVSSDDC